ncbi:MAG: dockerin type I repeat-containing protein, partial [Candidatus Zixiibacteriota bacterium]
SDTVYVPVDRVYPDSVYFWHVEAVNSHDESNGFTDAHEFTYAVFVCGDASGDGNVNLLDILYLIDHLYGDPLGPAPDPEASGDVNADGDVNLLDVLQLIDHLYGEPPVSELTCP